MLKLYVLASCIAGQPAQLQTQSGCAIVPYRHLHRQIATWASSTLLTCLINNSIMTKCEEPWSEKLGWSLGLTAVANRREESVMVVEAVLN